MKNYGKRMRSTIVDQDELETLLLKQAVYSALQGGASVSYNDRYFVHPYPEGFTLSKTEDLQAHIDFRPNQAAIAADAFLEQFFHESTCNIHKVLIHCWEPKDPGIPWSTLRGTLRGTDFLDPDALKMSLSHLVKGFMHEEINS